MMVKVDEDKVKHALDRSFNIGALTVIKMLKEHTKDEVLDWGKSLERLDEIESKR
jgi:post-segregation antitoxin (ccd killing protein)